MQRWPCIYGLTQRVGDNESTDRGHRSPGARSWPHPQHQRSSTGPGSDGGRSHAGLACPAWNTHVCPHPALACAVLRVPLGKDR